MNLSLNILIHIRVFYFVNFYSCIFIFLELKYFLYEFLICELVSFVWVDSY